MPGNQEARQFCALLWPSIRDILAFIFLISPFVVFIIWLEYKNEKAKNKLPRCPNCGQIMPADTAKTICEKSPCH
jgi:ribosomal protein S27AE